MKMENKKTTIVLLTLSAILFVVSIFTSVKWQKAEARVSAVAYEPVETETDQFYPGRASGDYSDMCFEMSAYLNSIGATEVQRYIYQTNDGTKQKLTFTLGNLDWTVETTIFPVGEYSEFGLYTSLEAKDKFSGTIYRIPPENCGTLMMDATSPFWFDRLAFDVLHIATDPSSELKSELREHMDSCDCPFYGLGLPHYDKDAKTGEVSWHDDMGNYLVEEGLDLHY